MYMNEKAMVREASRKLKALREELNYSTNEMSRRLGVQRASYWKQENGEVFPGFKSLKVLSVDFDISMDWLIFDKGPKRFSEKENNERLQALESELENEKKRSAELEEKVRGLQVTEQELSATRKDLIEAREEVDRLRERPDETDKQEQTTAPEFNLKPEIIELLEHMEKIPMLHYEIMLHLQNFKFEKKELVNEAMRQDEAG